MQRLDSRRSRVLRSSMCEECHVVIGRVSLWGCGTYHLTILEVNALEDCVFLCNYGVIARLRPCRVELPRMEAFELLSCKMSLCLCAGGRLGNDAAGQ